MRRTEMKKNIRLTSWLLAGVSAVASFVALPETASAQEILLTGPLAGAPPVRKLRLYREGRFFATPQVSFSLLDEYRRVVMPGVKLSYHFADWIGIGVEGSYGALQMDTGLTEKVSAENDQRSSLPSDDTTRRLTAVNMGSKFEDQLGSIMWTGALNITLIPFRGKLSVFDSVFADTDFYIFLGPAFVGLNERAACSKDGGEVNGCSVPSAFETEDRVAVTGNFGLGMTFYVDRFNSFFLEWKGIPVSRSIAGFDVAGGGAESAFPDNQFDKQDRSLRFNQFLTVGWNFALPLDYRVSE